MVGSALDRVVEKALDRVNALDKVVGEMFDRQGIHGRLAGICRAESLIKWAALPDPDSMANDLYSFFVGFAKDFK